MAEQDTAAALERVLARQEQEVRLLTAEYLATEEKYFEHTNGVVYEELDSSAKATYTRKLNELTKAREEVVQKVAKAKARLDTTNSLLGTAPSTPRTSPPAQSYRIPTLPSFRGEEKNAIKDAYEFLGKIKALLEAHQVPTDRWFSAILTTLTSIDRQWASANLVGLPWAELEKAFISHFESPVLRDKLIRDLMSITIKKKETVQEYSDRFTSLMRRTGKQDDDETLVAVYIDGLDSKLQELMRVTRASQLTMWSRLNQGTAPVSIAAEIENAIALDSTRKVKTTATCEEDSAKPDEEDKSRRKNRKKCAKCNKYGHSTEEHRDRKPTAKKATEVPAEQVEKKCWTCAKPWKPGHKCKEEDRKPQNNNIEVVYSGPEEEKYQDISEDPRENRTFGDELIESILYNEEAFNAPVLDQEESFGNQIIDAFFDKEVNINTTVLPRDAMQLIYTPVRINNINGWALVDSGATNTLISQTFVRTHRLQVYKVEGVIKDGSGNIMANRSGFVKASVKNGDKTVKCTPDILDMPDGRDMVIGIDHFKDFGYAIHGIPTKTIEHNADPDANKNIEDKDEDVIEVDGLTAKDLSEEVEEALYKNQGLPLSSRCTHPLAVLKINPTNKESIWRRMNFVSRKDEDKVSEKIIKWEEAKVIEPAPEDCANCFPLLCVPKKDAYGNKVDIRPCLDLRLLNPKLPDIDYPLPRIQEILDRLGSVEGSEVLYSTIDIRDSYFRFRIEESDRNWIAFKWKNKHYRFTCAPFGIKTMTSQFQMVMDKIFAEIPFVAVYVDDIVVFSKNKAEHIVHVKAVIDRLTEFNLLIRVDKSRFGQTKVRLLGFVVSGKGIEMDPSKATAISSWVKPKTVQQLLRFLGAANYYRQFVPNFSTISHPLDEVRKRKGVIKWTQEMENAFEDLRQHIAKKVVLSYPSDTKMFILGTDASDFGLGAWIGQENEDKSIQYLSFASRSLSKSEKKYSATKKELLAIVWSLQKFRTYLTGRRFTLYTDHRALVFLFTQTLNNMMQNWYDTLVSFDFDVVHVAGTKNILADALSRKDEALSLQALTVKHLIRGKKEPEKEGDRRSIIDRAHQFGHFGEQEVFKKIWHDGYWWENIRADIKEALSTCTPCLRYNVQKRGFHPLRSITADLPWDHIAIDLVTPLPLSENGYDTLLVIVDIMTKFCILRCLSSKGMEKIAKAVWEVFSTFGVPKIIQSDNGTEFVNQLITELVTLNGIEQRTISPYNPRANGAVERVNGTVETMLKKELNGAMHKWDDYIPYVQLAYNSKTSALTGSTPFSLMYGRALNKFEKYGRTKTKGDLSLVLWKKKQTEISESNLTQP